MRCPECQHKLKIHPEMLGHRVRCPKCLAVFRVEARPPADDPAPPVESPPFVPIEPIDPTEPTGSVTDPSAAAAAATNSPVPATNMAVVRAAIEHDAMESALSKPPKEIDHEELIDMTAMVDIVFFLLIFFLVTSMAGIQSSVKLPRPEAHDSESGGASQGLDEAQKDPDAIIVKITKDDMIEVDDVPFREISDVIVRLRQLQTGRGADASMLVIGHADATHGVAVAVLDAGYEVGINRLRLAITGDAAE